MDQRITDTRIRLVRNDTGPQVRLTITNQLTGLPVDLTGATVTLHFRNEVTGEFLFSRPLVVPALTAASGVAVIEWAADDLDQDAGDYEGEVEVVGADSIIQTIYYPLKFRIREEIA